MGSSRADAERILQERAPPLPKRKRQHYNAEQWLEYRVRCLPEQLQRARARVAQLEAEARAMGFTDLL
jgi:hypothetical protein